MDVIIDGVKKSTSRIIRRSYRFIIPVLAFAFLGTATAQAQLTFPVIGNATFSNDYTAPRASGPHHAIDIFAKKRAPIISATDGTVRYVAYPQPSWGYMITIESNTGWRYNYLHINNDTPGTDDGRGGTFYAYAPGMKVGDRVRKGQLLGWVGDSGNAENTAPHLHFEREKPNGDPVNPYYALREAKKLTRANPAPRQADEILPNGNNKQIIHVDVGNFAGDEQMEVVTGRHAGSTPTVAVYNRLNSRMHVFNAYASGFRGGIDVAAGDVDGDGYDEIITGPGKGGTPRVRIFKRDGTHVKDLWVYGNSFKGGVRVSAGDVDGDGEDEIIAGLGPGAEPRVRVYKLDGTLLRDFVSGRAGIRSGIDVAAGDVTGDNRAEIVTSYSRGSGPYVKVFDHTGNELRTITPYSTNNMGGVRIGVGNRNSSGKSQILTGLMTNGVPLVKLYGGNGQRQDSTYFWEEWWKGYYDVAIENGVAKGGTGFNRRSSVRDIDFRR